MHQEVHVSKLTLLLEKRTVRQKTIVFALVFDVHNMCILLINLKYISIQGLTYCTE